jgi:hypothetical protein
MSQVNLNSFEKEEDLYDQPPSASIVSNVTFTEPIDSSILPPLRPGYFKITLETLEEGKQFLKVLSC